MQKEIKEIKDNIIRVTILDERFYAKPFTNKETGLPEYKFYPSATWISDYYPKGIGYYKWLANKGWDEAEAIKVTAGDKGSKVHKATEDLEKGIKVKMDSKYYNNSTEEKEELTLEEYECLQSFINWHKENNPELLASEMTVFNEEHQYAGTLDRIYRIDGQIVFVDWKTSQYIWPSHEIQISAYAHADINYKKLGINDKEWKDRRLDIVQLGYRRNKKGYKVTTIEDKFDLFLTARMIWNNENPDSKPFQKDYPLYLSLHSSIKSKK